MKRPTAYVLIAGLVMLMSCKEDDGWTPQRREWIRKRCTERFTREGKEQACACVVREVTTTLSFKELVTGGGQGEIVGFTAPEFAALGVCGLIP